MGLTGGIASGKTLVSDLFAKHGVPVVDTDLISRELVQPGEPALAAIAQTFGADVIAADGSLCRPALRRRIVADAHQRRRLDAILHPRIRAAVQDRLKALDAGSQAPGYALVVVPLLVEAGMVDLVDRVLVVDAPKATQVTRVMARDQVTEDQAAGIVAAQAERDERLAVADDVVYNAGAREALAPQVEALHRQYLALTQRPAGGHPSWK